MAYDEEALTVYQSMVVERFRIWERRQYNEPPPWTVDPVLKNLKMTNMYRVLDPGSQFVFRLACDSPLDAIARLVFYRVTNLPSTWYAMRSALGNFPTAADFVAPQALLSALNTYRNAGNRIFSGAYIIIPEPGTANDKMEGAVRLTQRFVTEKAQAFFNADTQEERFAVLRSTPGLGPFLSMQILTDWGYLLQDEPDLSFVVAGPGARRGAAILNPDRPAEAVIKHCLDFGWRDHPVVQLQGRGLSMMDVQNTMCEWSKYAREIAKPRKKSAYQPAHPGVQTRPLLPEWW